MAQPQNYNQQPAPGYSQPAPVGYPQLPPYSAPPPQYGQPQQYPTQPTYPDLPPASSQPQTNRTIIIIKDKEHYCNSCHCNYEHLRTRKGIPYLHLFLILCLSCIFFLLFLFLFICLCQEYKVCPFCGHFTGHGESIGRGVCLF